METDDPEPTLGYRGVSVWWILELLWLKKSRIFWRGSVSGWWLTVDNEAAAVQWFGRIGSHRLLRPVFRSIDFSIKVVLEKLESQLLYSLKRGPRLFSTKKMCQNSKFDIYSFDSAASKHLQNSFQLDINLVFCALLRKIHVDFSKQ